MLVAVSIEEIEEMTFDEIVQAHIDRMGMDRDEAEWVAKILTYTADEWLEETGEIPYVC